MNFARCFPTATSWSRDESTCSNPRAKAGCAPAGSGFSAVELIIVVLVVLVLAAIAWPWIASAIARYRVRAGAWELVGDIRLVRQLAVSTQARHRICFASCSDVVPAGGYLLESEASGTWEVIRQHIPGRLTVTSNARYGKITFTAKGNASGATATLTGEGGTYKVVTSSTGRVRVCRGAC